MAATTVGSMKKYFRRLKDPRVVGRSRHLLVDIIVLAICGVIADCDDWHEIVLFAQKRLAWFKRFLKLPNGVPSHDTFERVFSKLEPRAFQGCCLAWLRAVADCLGMGHIAIDGKTLCGSAGLKWGSLHLVSAWATQANLTLGQVAVEGKSNEITAIPTLLELLDLNGALVSIDAMGCCEPTAHRFVLTDSASFRVGRFVATAHRSVLSRHAPFLRTAPMPFGTSSARKTTSASNRQRPLRGGSHERRTCGSSSSYYPAPRRPTCQGPLCRRRPLRGLVPQVVAPLSGGWSRGPLRPDAGQPPHCPAHPARTGTDHPLDPPPTSGPRHARHPLQPHRGWHHPRRIEEPRHPTTSLRAHHRARSGAQRFDRAAGPPGSAAAASGIPWPTGPSLQRTARGRSGRADLLEGPQPSLLHLGGQGYLRWGCLPASGLLPPHGRGPVVPRRVLEGPGHPRTGPTRQRARTGWLGAGGANPVTGDSPLPALRRQPGIHPGWGTPVQRQRGELQRLVPGTAVPTAFPPARRSASGAGTIASGRQHV